MATFSKCHYGGVWTDPSLARWYTLVPVLVSRLELVPAQRNFSYHWGRQRDLGGEAIWIGVKIFLKKGVALIIRFDKRET